MNKQWLDGMWDHMRQKYGMYLRVLDAIPGDRFHTHPVPGMRTPAELVVHTSGSIVRDIAEGVASGRIESGGIDEAQVAQGLDTHAQVLEFARECWRRADAAVQSVDDARLASPVESAWGIPVTGTFAMVVLNDEFLHHRGQLFTFVRVCGGEAPFMWGFEDNPEGFRPADRPS